MTKLKTLTDYSKRGAYDELYTPLEAINSLIPFIPKSFHTIWECTANGSTAQGNIAGILSVNGFDVVTSHIETGASFFDYEPRRYDAIITNPPYSIKNAFLERAYNLGKPFAFLLPLTALEGKFRGVLFGQHGVQVIIPNKRFNFKPEKGSSAWFQTSWFTWGFDLPSDLVFVNV